jgi:DNA replication protein DnaC
VIRKDDPERGLFLTGSCPEHTDYAELEAKGFVAPVVHPELPKRFHDTDVTRLHPSMQKAVLWSPIAGKAGLLMHGTSGIGKTRAAWHIVNRYWCEGLKQGYNLPVKFMSMRAFEKELIDSFEERRHGKVLEEICRQPFLVLDDLGKERLTSRMATDLFSVVDHRTERDLPTIVTTNFSGKAFLDRFLPQDKETGLATARRFRDYFEIVGMAAPASQ